MGQDIDWVSLKVAQTKAFEKDKKVLIFAEAEWCGYCKKMDEEVFRIQAVTDSLKKYFYGVRLNIESDDTVRFNGERFSKQSLARKFRAFRTPTTIFLDTDGSFVGLQPGFIPGKIYENLLAYIGAERYKNQSFEEYLRDHSIEIK